MQSWFWFSVKNTQLVLDAETTLLLLFHLFFGSSNLCIYEPAGIKCFAVLWCFQWAIEWNNRTYYDSGWKWSANDFMHQVWGKKTNTMFLIIMQLKTTYRFIGFFWSENVFPFFLIRYLFIIQYSFKKIHEDNFLNSHRILEFSFGIS